MRRPIIGVTEAGDGGLDLSWAKRLAEVDGAVIITKQLTPGCQNLLAENQTRCILHHTITGLGGTVLEPNVPDWSSELRKAKDFCDDVSFPKEQVVIRVDPIVPTDDYLPRAQAVLQTGASYGFKRFRVSVLDMYAHVIRRFRNAGVRVPYTNFHAPTEKLLLVDSMIYDIKQRYQDIVVEACAEQNLKHVRHCGCVSEYDLNILGIDFDELDAAGYQCMYCMCYSGKKELLKHKERCAHKCLYCFWKTDKERT